MAECRRAWPKPKYPQGCVGSNPTLTTINNIKVGNIMDLKKQLIENRISLLRSRDPVSNTNIIRKLERRLRKMK